MTRPKNIHGLTGMLAFLEYLRKNKILYRVDHRRDDALMAIFTLVGARVEVEFFEDHIEYSFFSGDESVDSDEGDLFAIIAKKWQV